MKVLNIMSRFNVGGTSKWLYHLSKGLEDHCIDSLLVIGDCPDYEIEDERVLELRTLRIPGLNPSSTIYQSFKAFLLLRKVMKSFEPDLINTHASKGGFIGRLAAFSLFQRKKVIHTYHGHVMRGYFPWPKQTFIHIIEFFLSYLTDAFIVVGENVLSELRSLGIIRNKFACSVVPAVEDYISIGEVKPLVSIPVPQDRLIIGWLGRKVQIKRLDRILEIASQRPHLHFLIAGVGNSVFASTTGEYRQSDFMNVTEIGFITPSDFWPLCDISIITSDNEGIPSAPIEAALARVPTITTNVGSASEVVDDGISGFVTSTNLEEILQKIDLVSEDSQLREQMGNMAREIALDRFDPKKSIQHQIYLYKSVLNEF